MRGQPLYTSSTASLEKAARDPQRPAETADEPTPSSMPAGGKRPLCARERDGSAVSEP